MKTFIFGEAMLEYHSHGRSGLRFGGDTLNTAIHLARGGHEVAYVTAVGTDPISQAMVAAWSSEGIDTRHVLRHPALSPGMYAIYLDDDGERSFLYWRDRSAAREMFELGGIEQALVEAEAADLVCFSLISLAVIDGRGGERLLSLAEDRRAAGKAVAYDSNFRAALWPSIERAREVSQRAMASASLGLPTNTDECQLWGTDEDERSIARRWKRSGCDTVIVKAAEKGCFAHEEGDDVHHHAAGEVLVVDSSGAGDAFNAGFINGWLSGNSLESAVAEGQSLARSVLGHMGAIP